MTTTEIYCIWLPTVDEWGRPRKKLPNCPNCGEDEIGLLSEDRGICYRCNVTILRRPRTKSVTEFPAVCNACPWMGAIKACEVTDEGDIMCPQCRNEIAIRIENGQ